VRLRDEQGLAIRYFKVFIRAKNGSLQSMKFGEADSLYKGPKLKAGESLHLYSLERAFHRPFILRADSMNNFDITLRIPPNMPLGGRSRLSTGGSMQLLMKGDSLVSYGPEWGGNVAAFKRLP
jgi:hypothetical protein